MIYSRRLCVWVGIAWSTAAQLAAAQQAAIPITLALDAPIPGIDEKATSLRELTAMFSQDYGVRVDFLALRSRAISPS